MDFSKNYPHDFPAILHVYVALTADNSLKILIFKIAFLRGFHQALSKGLKNKVFNSQISVFSKQAFLAITLLISQENMRKCAGQILVLKCGVLASKMAVLRTHFQGENYF